MLHRPPITVERTVGPQEGVYKDLKNWTFFVWLAEGREDVCLKLDDRSYLAFVNGSGVSFKLFDAKAPMPMVRPVPVKMIVG